MKPIFSRQSRLSPETPDPLLMNALGLPATRHEAPEIHPDPPALIAKTREQAIQAVDEIVCGLSADVRQADARFLEWYCQQLLYHFNVVQTVTLAKEQAMSGRTLPAADHDPAIPQYFISSRFLTECHNFLIADPNGFERLHLVTGIAIDGNRFTLDQMQKVALSHQSIGGAQADQQSFTQALIHLTETGHALHGLFHSHPRQGPAATHPSDTDVTTHKRLEQGGYPLIGAIFVPGYMRFFSTNRPFTVTIYGTGVTPVPGETHVYKIQRPSIPRGVSDEAIAGS